MVCCRRLDARGAPISKPSKAKIGNGIELQSVRPGLFKAFAFPKKV